jgi:uncharacterized Zn-binding protein involved in type VI secretion
VAFLFGVSHSAERIGSMSKPAARITDMHTCAMVTGIVPHVGGPIIVGSPNVLTGSLPQARVTDVCICAGPPDMIVKGSASVLVNSLPAARIGDQTTHGGVIVTGLATVLIGDAGGGGNMGPGGATAPPGKPCMKEAAKNNSPFVKP